MTHLSLNITNKRISLLAEDELDALILDLFTAQAHVCKSDQSQIRVNTDSKAPDDGCDGWTAMPSENDDWLGDVDTCWQLKAGKAGEPAKLKGEILKSIPKRTLISGGRFVLVASGSTNGLKGEQDRLCVLREEAEGERIPVSRIDVLGSERLAVWCNKHPAVAAKWAGMPTGLLTLADWENDEVHQVPWSASDSVKTDIERLRGELDFDGGDVQHLHIYGQPGVGKTRYALELCRVAAWSVAVVYVRQANDVRLAQLIDSVAEDKSARLIVVADEVQPNQLLPLRDSVGRSNGRIRLITIGHCSTPDPARIPAQKVSPLDGNSAKEIIRYWHPSMPPEHIEFVVRFSDGFIRLAKLSADAVVRYGASNVHELVERSEITGFLDSLLGDYDRRPLHVASVLSNVGWNDDKEEEGKSIAGHLGLDWNDVRYRVNEFHRRFGIAPRSGRYVYISPNPLGIYLALEAWKAYPEELRSLVDVLPSQEAKDAYLDRLKSMSKNIHAREYAIEELSFFFRIDDFIDARSVHRWSALTFADPELASRNILNALISATIDERLKIDGDARRVLVYTLVKLAWRKTSFSDAVKSLAFLGEAENETWGNNASEEFVNRYQLHLGGTAVPYLDRLFVLDELLQLERTEITRLVIKALSRIYQHSPIRFESNYDSPEIRDKEWFPQPDEVFNCVEAAIERLIIITNLKIPELENELINTSKHLSMMLRDSNARPLIIKLFISLKGAYPDSREYLRRFIADVIHRERKYWNELSEKDLNELDQFHAQFEDDAFSARLHQNVGVSKWDREDEPDYASLAREILASSDALKGEWSWLTSGDAADAWRFGEILAEADSTKELLKVFPTLQATGPDLRLISGYINSSRKELGDDWYDQWVKAQFERDPKPTRLIFETAWRCGLSSVLIKYLIEILENEEVNVGIVGQLSYARWDCELPQILLENLLRSLIASGHSATAIAILEQRLKECPSEDEVWQPLALNLATSPELIRSGDMTNYHWKELALKLVNLYPGQIASAIMHEQADRKTGSWFAQYSQAEEVLLSCVDVNPTEVMRAMLPHLKSKSDAYLFSLGFPKEVVDKLPHDEIMAWVSKNPDERAPLIARFLPKIFTSDDSLISRVIGNYGDKESVADAFLSEYISGAYSGPSSEHWQLLAENLENIASKTKLPRLEQWATKSSKHLHKMAESDRQSEEEEDIGR